MSIGQALEAGVGVASSYCRAKLAQAVRGVNAVVRVDATPHRLALGLALGIFMATTPFLGLQVCGAMGLAWLFGASVPAAVMGTFWANPITCPLLWLASYRLGASLLAIEEGGEIVRLAGGFDAVKSAALAPGRSTLGAAFDLLWPVAKPLTLGAVLIGMVSAAVFYCVARRVIVGLNIGVGTAKQAEAPRLR